MIRSPFISWITVNPLGLMAPVMFLRTMLPNLNEIPYDGQISRADYGVYRSKVGDDLIITTSLSEIIDFIRTVEEAKIAVTYLDAAALEILEPAVIFSPDWDGIIKENL